MKTEQCRVITEVKIGLLVESWNCLMSKNTQSMFVSFWGMFSLHKYEILELIKSHKKQHQVFFTIAMKIGQHHKINIIKLYSPEKKYISLLHVK